MYPTPYFNQFNQQPQFQQPQFQQPIHGFVYVNGIEGARAYQMPPNSEMPLFDSNNDGVMYVKTTDGAGYPTITVADCVARGEKQVVTDYVTRDELDRVYHDFSAQIDSLKEAMNATVPTTPTAGESDASAFAGKPTAIVPAAR